MGMARDVILARIMAEPGANLRISRALKITTGAVSQWQRVPVSHVRAVAHLTGIPPHVLRPDIFDPPSAPARCRGT